VVLVLVLVMLMAVTDVSTYSIGSTAEPLLTP